MPIIPEKRQLEDHVHGAVAAQFWSQGIENTRCLTGQSCTAPCEPQPLRLNAPSGLSRTQFLVAAHAVRVPVFPGFCDEHGGTVLDRVLLQHGGQSWWGALIGRVKVQRAVHQRSAKTLRQNLADPDNYAMAATGRLQLSKSTSLKVTAQVDSLQQLQPLMPQGGRVWPPQQQQQRGVGQQPQQQQQPQRAGWSKMGQNSSLSLQLKQQLEGLDVLADLAVNETSVEGVRRYCSTPLRLAVDVAPSSSGSSGKGSKLKGLLFRVGLHGVVAPVEDTAAAGRVEQQQQQHALSVHCQGAIAVTGSKVLWEAAERPWQAAAAAAKELHQRQQKQRQRQLELAEQRLQQEEEQQQQQHVVLSVQPLELGDAGSSKDIIASGATAVAGDGDETCSTGGPAGSTAGGEQQLTGSSNSSGGIKEHRHHHHRHHHKHRSGTTSSTPASTLSDNSSSRRSTSKLGGSSRGGTTDAIGGPPSHSSHAHSSTSKQRYLTFRGEEIALPLCNSGSVQESVQDGSSRIERLRTDLRLWRTRVEAGELQNLGQGGKQQQGRLGLKEPGSCWSSFLAGPHLKVSGLIGLLGRVPLQQRMLLLPSAAPLHHPSSSSTSLASSTADTQGSTGGTAAVHDERGTSTATAAVPYGKPLAGKARSFLAASATHLDRLVLRSARKLGSSITQESQLRLFGSGGVSMQLGEMRGNFFDYTRLEGVLDVGLNAPETAASSSSSSAVAGGVRRGANSSSSRAGRQSRTRGGSSSGRGSHLIGSPGRGLGSILGPAAVDLAAAAAAPGDILADAGSSSSTSAAPAAAQIVRPPTVSAVAGKQHKHPAFALEDRAVWHALTVSATQQLVGPVRLRGDWRFALDSNHPCPSGTALLQPSAPLQVLRHVAGMSPALVDSAYGVDVVVPGAGGLVRLVGWYSPVRKEGGLEIRLM